MWTRMLKDCIIGNALTSPISAGNFGSCIIMPYRSDQSVRHSHPWIRTRPLPVAQLQFIQARRIRLDPAEGGRRQRTLEAWNSLLARLAGPCPSNTCGSSPRRPKLRSHRTLSAMQLGCAAWRLTPAFTVRIGAPPGNAGLPPRRITSASP